MMSNLMHCSNLDGVGRFYHLDSGESYPSVTTVLQALGLAKELLSWREAIGDERADAITQEAGDIGSFMHNCYEQYLSNEVISTPETNPEKIGLKLYKASKIKFDQLVETHLHLEKAVWSHELQIAGRFDLICRLKSGKIALLDFKNTRRDKTRKDIDNYFLQLAFYHHMIAESDIPDVPEEHIIFMVNRDGFTKVFRNEIDAVSIERLKEVREKFRHEYGY